MGGLSIQQMIAMALYGIAISIGTALLAGYWFRFEATIALIGAGLGLLATFVLYLIFKKDDKKKQGAD